MTQYIQRHELEKLGQLKLDAGAALYRLHRYYCDPMKTRGLCTMHCTKDCGARIRSIIRTPGDNPEASFTWACREVLAKFMDDTEHAADKDGTNQDVFGLLGSML